MRRNPGRMALLFGYTELNQFKKGSVSLCRSRRVYGRKLDQQPVATAEMHASSAFCRMQRAFSNGAVQGES
jgi:hypothetical protein